MPVLRVHVSGVNGVYIYIKWRIFCWYELHLAVSILCRNWCRQLCNNGVNNIVNSLRATLYLASVNSCYKIAWKELRYYAGAKRVSSQLSFLVGGLSNTDSNAMVVNRSEHIIERIFLLSWCEKGLIPSWGPLRFRQQCNGAIMVVNSSEIVIWLTACLFLVLRTRFPAMAFHQLLCSRFFELLELLEFMAPALKGCVAMETDHFSPLSESRT